MGRPKASITSKGDRAITMSLTDFGVFYRQEDLDALTADMRPDSKVTVDKGQVMRVTKAKSGEVTEVLTKTWDRLDILLGVGLRLCQPAGDNLRNCDALLNPLHRFAAVVTAFGEP